MASRPIMRRCLGHLSVSLSAKVSVSLTPSLLVSVGLPSACLCGMASETEITAQSTYYSTADFPLSDVDVLESSLSLFLSLFELLVLATHFGQVETQCRALSLSSPLGCRCFCRCWVITDPSLQRQLAWRTEAFLGSNLENFCTLLLSTKVKIVGKLPMS